MHDVAQLAADRLLGAPFHRAQTISDHVAKAGPVRARVAWSRRSAACRAPI
jgi:hypothetical protein